MGVCLAPSRFAVTASAPANEQSCCSAAGWFTARFASRAWSTNTRVHETCTSACGAATVCSRLRLMHVLAGRHPSARGTGKRKATELAGGHAEEDGGSASAGTTWSPRSSGNLLKCDAMALTVNSF